MATNKNHQAHMDLQSAFESADADASKGVSDGHVKYGMAASSGMPRSPGQMASVNKAAKASAASRGLKASAMAQARSPKAGITPGPAAAAAGPLKPSPGVSTGGLALVKKPKKGLLSL